MKIEESKIQEYNGASFSVNKVDGISVLTFNDSTGIDNTETYAKIMLGDCPECNKMNELYKDFTYDKVLVLGLGLGLLAETLKVEKGCSVVDVIDNNQELIDYVDYLDNSINIIKGDALSYTPNKKYDLILVDLWWGNEDINWEVISSFIGDIYTPYLENNGKILIPIIYKSIQQ